MSLGELSGQKKKKKKKKGLQGLVGLLWCFGGATRLFGSSLGRSFQFFNSFLKLLLDFSSVLSHEPFVDKLCKPLSIELLFRCSEATDDGSHELDAEDATVCLCLLGNFCGPERPRGGIDTKKSMEPRMKLVLVF